MRIITPKNKFISISVEYYKLIEIVNGFTITPISSMISNVTHGFKNNFVLNSIAFKQESNATVNLFLSNNSRSFLLNKHSL